MMMSVSTNINIKIIGTWKDKESSDTTFWPGDPELLPTDCPTARIVSFGYNAEIAKFYPESSKTIAPELTIDDYSTALFEALKLLRGDKDTVSHSLMTCIFNFSRVESLTADLERTGPSSLWRTAWEG